MDRCVKTLLELNCEDDHYSYLKAVEVVEKDKASVLVIDCFNECGSITDDSFTAIRLSYNKTIQLRDVLDDFIKREMQTSVNEED